MIEDLEKKKKEITKKYFKDLGMMFVSLIFTIIMPPFIIAIIVFTVLAFKRAIQLTKINKQLKTLEINKKNEVTPNTITTSTDILNNINKNYTDTITINEPSPIIGFTSDPHEYIKLFDSEDITFYENNLDDSFINKITRTEVDDYEKFMKFSGTTKRPGSFVVFDLETTGLSAKSSEIIEIGAIRFIASEPSEIFHYYVKPKKNITAKITSINGITNEMVKDAPTIEEVLPKFIDFIKDDVLIAHNASFDMSFILENLYNLNYKKIKNKVIDTLKLSRQKVREFDYDRENGIKLDNYKLETLKWRFDLSDLPSHNAIDDCKVCAYVYLRIRECYGDMCFVEF
ncbi:MAG: PolC-type DNA polymerase III [Clostridium sp.]|jgi:DNA polymerase-3 subunit epsilon